MLIVSQKSWTAGDTAALEAFLATLRRMTARFEVERAIEPFVLLPQAAPSDTAVLKSDLLERLSTLSAEHGLYIAGAAETVEKVGAVKACTAFVIGSDGNVLIDRAKISPELVNGLAVDQTAAVAEPGNFQAVQTPIGQVAILPGEDILFPHYVRASVWKGAEIILNPSSELGDNLLEARRNARVARCFENTCFVAVASAPTGASPDGSVEAPAMAGVADWTGKLKTAEAGADVLLYDIEIDKLRRRRSSIFGVIPLHLRANLYADGYKAIINKRQKAPARPKTRDDWVATAKDRLAEAKEKTGTGRENEWDVILVQDVKKTIQKTSDPHAVRMENIERVLRLPARIASNPNNRLVVFSEFFLTGQGGHGYRSPITLQRLAIRYPGPELELFSEFATKHKIYVAGSSFEIDDKLPGHVFNSAFIINDSGDLIHRYRKIQCADVWGSLPDTTPGSIYDRYLDVYGYDYLFPVADTPLGKLATMVCFDQAHPEIARMMVKNGAEVIIHPTSEGHGSGRRGWDIARQTRAFENTAYILSPMPGGEYFDPNSKYEHTNQMRGYTKIVNFDGSIQGVLDTPGEAILTGNVDLVSLRRARANPHVNLAMWDDAEVYADDYAGDIGLPNNLWTGGPLENPYVGMRPLKARLADYFDRGIFVPPTEKTSRTLAVPGKAPPEVKREEPQSLSEVKKMDGEYIQV